MSAPRVLAFYLPQFHPTPENDAWWGPGFSEWRSVAEARPLFEGHRQPDLPGELGFYDLRLAETRLAQAELARRHGIHGFCYYHYWFNGRRLLARPFDEMLASGEPDFPFCLCWANENWTRAWDGHASEILVGQRYGSEDDRQHLRFLARVFADPRYIRIDGRPLLLVYRTGELPDPRATAAAWRDEARRLGVGELFLATVESLRTDRPDPTRIGFDAAVEFAPDWLVLPAPDRVVEPNNRIYDYERLADAMLAKPRPAYRRFPGVATGWDNTPRRRADAFVFEGSTPERYERWLREASANRQPARTPDEDLVFVNAWNEWAEGAHLEPGARFGRAYLEATARVIAAPPAAQRGAALPAGAVGAPIAPPVTVAIPTFDGGRYLRAAITSVLAQSFAELELLVVDDDSRDDSFAIAASFDDPRIRCLRNPTRLGLVGNWNRCLAEARGRYVSIFHQDDLMAPDNLARKVALLEANAGVGFVYSNVRQIGPADERISDHWYHPSSPTDPELEPGHDFFRREIAGVNLVCAPSVVLRRDLVARVGGFDPALPFTADWEMWLRLALYADVGFVADSLVDYRRHDDMETNRFLGVDGLSHELAAKRRVLDGHPDRVPDGRALLVRCFAHVVEEAWIRARAARAAGDSAGALAYFEFASWAHAEAVRDAGGEYSARLLERLVAEPPRAVATPEPPPAAFAEVAVAAEAAQLAEAAELEMLRRLREEIFASRSWRLTAPLRWLKARLDRAD